MICDGEGEGEGEDVIVTASIMIIFIVKFMPQGKPAASGASACLRGMENLRTKYMIIMLFDNDSPGPLACQTQGTYPPVLVVFQSVVSSQHGCFSKGL